MPTDNMGPADVASTGVNATVTTDANGDRNVLVTNGPVPDTEANRARYGQPLSNAGNRTQPAGN